MRDLKRKHASPEKEKALIAAIAESPKLHYELNLPKEVFFEHGDLYEKIANAVESEQEPPAPPDDWSSAQAPRDVAEELKRSWKRYHVELFQEDECARVIREDDPPEEVVRGMRERADQLLSALESAFEQEPSDDG